MEDLSAFSQAENDLIKEKFNDLLQDYLNSNHLKKVEIITKAFDFANRAHYGIRRISREPYIIHPLAVAKICCNEMGLGATSICSALLHDVVEDTEYTVKDIEKNFGPKIAYIVDGLTKISGGKFGELASAQAEYFRKLLLTMTEDIRVILIKMADRLHNMRTLGSLLPNKQYKIAGETMYLYAPLANRLGMDLIKTELENLSFNYEHPNIYAELSQKIENTKADRNELYEIFTAPIKERLDKLELTYRICARTKSIFSIWDKMQKEELPFEEISDILAIRIIFDTILSGTYSAVSNVEREKCGDIYTAITYIYKIHPHRIRDYVSTPKSNGYQAFHVTVMGPDGKWIEIQILSTRMDDIAEHGIASGWNNTTIEIDEENKLSRWINSIKEILENPEPDAIDFLSTIKMDMFSSEIFVFTPKGDIKKMAVNSTVLDFAFELHSDIGFHCIGAKVDHVMVSISHVLISGNQVEILTSKNQIPKYEWLNYVTTGRAQKQLRERFRKGNKQIKQNTASETESSIDYKTPHKLKEDDLGTKYRLADCCKPIPGEDVLGYVDNNGNIFIHKRLCPVAMKLESSFGSRIISSEWDTFKVITFPVELELRGFDDVGIVSQITKIVSDDMSVNISKLMFETKDGIFNGNIELLVHDVNDVNKLCMEISKIKNVQKVYRKIKNL